MGQLAVGRLLYFTDWLKMGKYRRTWRRAWATTRRRSLVARAAAAGADCRCSGCCCRPGTSSRRRADRPTSLRRQCLETDADAPPAPPPPPPPATLAPPITVLHQSCILYRHLFVSVLWHCRLGVTKSNRPVKNRVMRCLCGYLSAARCSLSAYGPADAAATQNPIISCVI